MTKREFEDEYNRLAQIYLDALGELQVAQGKGERIGKDFWQRLETIMDDLMRHAATLDPATGQIRSPRLFMDAIGWIKRQEYSIQIFHEVTKKRATMGGSWIPKPHSKSRVICEELQRAGDIRFRDFGSAAAYATAPARNAS